MDDKIKYVLLTVIVGLVLWGILAGTYADSVKNIYAFNPQNVTLTSGQVVETPAPFIAPSLQVKLLTLAPFGIVFMLGLGVFLILTKGRK